MGATALVVVLACLAVERSGPVVGGLIATLPINAGPGFVFLAMEHDAAFIADSATGGIRALTATVTFTTIYALLVPRMGLAVGLGTALAAWLSIVLAVSATGAGIFAGYAGFLLVFAACFRLTRAARAIRAPSGGAAGRWDMPLRAMAAMALVATVLALGRLLGPAAAGIAALAPVVMTSLGLLLYPRIGPPGAAAMMANALPGMFGNAIALVVLNRTAVPIGAVPALLLTLAVWLAWNAALGVAQWRLTRRG